MGPTLYGLQRLGMIQPDHRAIGVGAGRECVIFWLGDRIHQVVATDLYGSGDWATSGGREADAAVVENPQKFRPRPIRSEAIEFKVMDGTNLGAYADATFDFSWSLSSIEHFGSHEQRLPMPCAKWHVSCDPVASWLWLPSTSSSRTSITPSSSTSPRWRGT